MVISFCFSEMIFSKLIGSGNELIASFKYSTMEFKVVSAIVCFRVFSERIVMELMISVRTKKLIKMINRKAEIYLVKILFFTNFLYLINRFGRENVSAKNTCGSRQELKLIADSPNGFQHPFVAHALKLFAKSLHMDVDRSRISEIVEAPYLVEQLVTGKYPVIV